MAGIPEVLQQFTAYLQAENTKLENDKKQQRINDSISEVATKFKKLPGDASTEDIQSLLFETITDSVENNAPEVIPLIQGFYNTTIQTHQLIKQEKGDEVLKEELHKSLGVPIDKNITSDQTLALYNAKLSSMKDFNFTDENKYGYIRRYKTDYNGSLTLVPNSEVIINKFGAKEEQKLKQDEALFENKLAMQRIRYQNSLSAQNIGSYVTKDGLPIVDIGDTRKVSVYDKITQKTSLINWTPEMGVMTVSQYGNIGNRTFQQNKDLVTKFEKDAKANATAIINLLKSNDVLPDDVRRAVYNAQDKNKVDPNVAVKILNSLNSTPVTDKTGQTTTRLNEIIGQIDDQDTRDELAQMVEQGMSSIGYYNQGLEGMTNQNPPIVKDINNANISVDDWNSVKSVLSTLPPGTIKEYFPNFPVEDEKLPLDKEMLDNYLDLMLKNDPKAAKQIYNLLKNSAE